MQAYKIEGLVNGQWSAAHVAQDDEAATFPTLAQAEAAVAALVGSGDGYHRNRLRVVEVALTRGAFSNNPTGTGAMLAFGATDADCFAQLQEIGGDYDPSEDDCLSYRDVTPALAATDGGWWRYLPGTEVACTRAEFDAAVEAK